MDCYPAIKCSPTSVAIDTAPGSTTTTTASQPAASTLPVTGGDVVSAALAGLALITAGTILAFRSRRHDHWRSNGHQQ